MRLLLFLIAVIPFAYLFEVGSEEYYILFSIQLLSLLYLLKSRNKR